MDNITRIRKRERETEMQSLYNKLLAGKANSSMKEAYVSTSPPPQGSETSDKELLRMTRQAVVAELDAANLYQEIAERIEQSHSDIAEIFNDIADEELVHVGEFNRVIAMLSPEEIDFYDEGEAEAAEVKKK